MAYALLLASKPQYVSWFAASPAAAARTALDYVLTYTNGDGTVNGGRGQYASGVLDPDYVIPWWSTEHNIDIWWCLDLAASLFDDLSYRTAADAIQAALLSFGWDDANGIFWQGGGHGGDPTEHDGSHALDTHTWGAALLQRWGNSNAARTSIDRALAECYVTDAATGLSGLTTFIAEGGYPPETVKTPWYEGSFGAVVALRLLDVPRANRLLSELRRGQRRDGSWVYALQIDAVNDIHPWPCIIAPAWSILAEAGPGTSTPPVLWQRP